MYKRQVVGQWMGSRNALRSSSLIQSTGGVPGVRTAVLRVAYVQQYYAFCLVHTGAASVPLLGSIRLRTNIHPMFCERVLVHGRIIAACVRQGIRSTYKYSTHVLQRVFVARTNIRPMFLRGYSFHERMFAPIC